MERDHEFVFFLSGKKINGLRKRKTEAIFQLQYQLELAIEKNLKINNPDVRVYFVESTDYYRGMVKVYGDLYDQIVDQAIASTLQYLKEIGKLAPRRRAPKPDSSVPSAEWNDPEGVEA